MRLDILITGTPEERADVEARSSQFCADYPDARVRARIMETITDRKPVLGRPGEQQCRDCGCWYPAGERHECLQHGGIS